MPAFSVNGKLAILSAIAAMFFFFSPASLGAEESGGGKENILEFSRDPRLERIKPPKPVEIELRRLSSGKYTWELEGEDVDRIIEIDRRLKKELVEE